MKIAIHHRTNSFRKWIEYCNENNIDCSTVNCRDNDILEKLKILMNSRGIVTG